MISYISDLEKGTGMGNYATQLYRHMADQTDEIENVPLEATGFSFAPRLVNEFYKLPRACYKANGDTVFLPEMNYGGLAHAPLRKDLVVTVHDIIPLVTDYAPWISRKIMEQQAKVIQRADTVIAISEHTKEDLIGHLGIDEDRINVIYQGVDTDIFTPQERDEEVLSRYGIDGPYLLYVGAEKWRKNFEGVLRAFATIKEHRPKLSLVKVGPGGRQEYRDHHREVIEDVGIEDSVVFTGFIEEAHLPQIYSSAEALLQLSWYEGFGRAPLEAMACGTIPIVSDRTSLPEVVGAVGHTVDIEQDNTGDRIADLLEEPATTDELIKRAKTFSWEKTARKTLEAINSV
jgi:glycosyltransferase involved in cell wall biosynthesis